MATIDARTATITGNYRPYTVKGAVHQAISQMGIGENIAVDQLIDVHGEMLGKSRLDTYIAAVRGEKRFTCRSGRNGILATVTRIA